MSEIPLSAKRVHDPGSRTLRDYTHTGELIPDY